MSVRNIKEYKKDAVLRKKSNYVKKVNRKIMDLIRDMADTMYHANGVGLAAPQVGISKRVITIDIGSGLISLINPEIVEQKGNQTDIEGCLSIPGIVGEVIRPNWVRIRSLNEKGEQVELEGMGLLARAFCHEIDHLDGILFIDKLVPGTDKNINI
ncbi:MAG: peptide deformylase [Acholeplasmataceae bacterium]|nr:peptide deformylase [Acholeplasmataceae bacterium]